MSEPQDPQVERTPVPGGTLLGVRTQVYARRIMPNPGNPRNGPARRHQFAVAPGSAGEDCRFQPIPKPRTPAGRPGAAPELAVDIDSRPHPEWACVQAAKYIQAENDWRQSIASQGVMETVWLVATTFAHADGATAATAVVTVEGSSRTTAAHSLLGVISADEPYEDPDAKLRAVYKKLNAALDAGTTTGEQQVALRCERMPAVILVGFVSHKVSTAQLPTAVKSLVALRHVDPPKAWGEGPENEALADEVLAELFRRGLVPADLRAYLAGSITKAAARKAHLSDDPAVRAAKVVEVFARPGDEDGRDEAVEEAIRVAVTSQSTRKKITGKLCNPLATALIVRSLTDDRTKRDQTRRYLSQAFGRPVYEQRWAATNRDTDALEAAALAEVRAAIADPAVTEVGPASLELMVRAAYPLVVRGAISGERGGRNDSPDQRTVGEVLNAMRRKPQGVRQLAQALRDFAAGLPVRVVDEAGVVQPRAAGVGDQVASDTYLRNQFPPPGKAPAKTGGTTSSEVFRDRVSDFTTAMAELHQAFQRVQAVEDGGGSAMADIDGVDAEECVRWSGLLSDMLGELRAWEKTYRRKHGGKRPRCPTPPRTPRTTRRTSTLRPPTRPTSGPTRPPDARQRHHPAGRLPRRRTATEVS